MASNFRLINKGAGAMHIDGFDEKTRGEFNYSLSPCGGLTRIATFHAVRFTANDLTELAEQIALADKLGHRICKTCRKNADAAIAAAQAEPVAETFEIVYESMNSKGEISRRRVSGPTSKRDAVIAELLTDSKFVQFVS